MTQEKIIESAIIDADGNVVTGKRHADCINRYCELYQKGFPFGDSFQGFITTNLRFVDRKEAAIIAIKAGQITETKYLSDGRLDSSDLF